METTKFIDLSLKLGFPYLYTHLGDCEHLLIFTSLKSALFYMSLKVV